MNTLQFEVDKLPTPKYPECEAPSKQIIVYICPTKGCTNYYASENFKPGSGIEIPQVTRNSEDGEWRETHPRTECPDCRAGRGIHVQRVPHIVTQVIPLKTALHVYQQSHD